MYTVFRIGQMYTVFRIGRMYTVFRIGQMYTVFVKLISSFKSTLASGKHAKAVSYLVSISLRIISFAFR